MQLSTWEPIYQQILEDFGFSRKEMRKLDNFYLIS